VACRIACNTVLWKIGSIVPVPEGLEDVKHIFAVCCAWCDVVSNLFSVHQVVLVVGLFTDEEE